MADRSPFPGSDGWILRFTRLGVAALLAGCTYALAAPVEASAQVQRQISVQTLQHLEWEEGRTGPIMRVSPQLREVLDPDDLPSLEPGDVWLPVRPYLQIETPPRPVQGLGVQTAPVTVSVRGRRLEEPVVVRLEATPRGSVHPDVVEIGAEGIAWADVRSEGVGRAEWPVGDWNPTR